MLTWWLRACLPLLVCRTWTAGLGVSVQSYLLHYCPAASLCLCAVLPYHLFCALPLPLRLHSSCLLLTPVAVWCCFRLLFFSTWHLSCVRGAFFILFAAIAVAIVRVAFFTRFAWASFPCCSFCLQPALFCIHAPLHLLRFAPAVVRCWLFLLDAARGATGGCLVAPDICCLFRRRRDVCRFQTWRATPRVLVPVLRVYGAVRCVKTGCVAWTCLVLVILAFTLTHTARCPLLLLLLTLLCLCYFLAAFLGFGSSHSARQVRLDLFYYLCDPSVCRFRRARFTWRWASALRDDDAGKDEKKTLARCRMNYLVAANGVCWFVAADTQTWLNEHFCHLSRAGHRTAYERSAVIQAVTLPYALLP